MSVLNPRVNPRNPGYPPPPHAPRARREPAHFRTPVRFPQQGLPLSMTSPSLRPGATRVKRAAPLGRALSTRPARGRRLGLSLVGHVADVSSRRADEARRPAPWAETQGRGVVLEIRWEGGELS